jgi:prepilin-type N-terminal cleavage/methylation domain-containing protein
MLLDLRKDHAFTLTELLIVIAIVGILAAVGLTYYRSQYIAKARLSEVTSSG